MIDVHGVRLKLDRAQEHWNTLDAEFYEFAKYARAGFDTYVYGEPPPAYVFGSVFREATQPPPKWGPLVGDLIHNLRSALDQLVWQLVIDNDERPGRHNSFPVYAEEGEWVRDVEARDPRRGKGPLHGLAPCDFARIKSLQPYHWTATGHDPRNDDLAILARLSNIDKHQTIVAGFLFVNEPGSVVVHSEVPMVVEESWALSPPGKMLHPGTEIARVRVRKAVPGDRVKVKVDVEAKLTLGFGRPGDLIIRKSRFSQIMRKVEEVVSGFER